MDLLSDNFMRDKLEQVEGGDVVRRFSAGRRPCVTGGAAGFIIS